MTHDTTTRETATASAPYGAALLESVSLTKLDQTDIKFFNQDNYFDAEGLTILKSTTESKRRERNAIVRENEVAIAQKDLEARQQTLTIERTKKEAELSQERDIANKTAATRAEVAQVEQTAKLTEETARIETERAVATKNAEAEQAKQTATIEANLAVNKRKTDAERDIQITTQVNQIQIAEKSKSVSEATADAKTAEAIAVAAEEKVLTARAIEVADRARQTQVLAARTEAERKSTEIIVAAEAEKKAAVDRAEAVKTAATAEAEANTIRATGIEKLGEAEAKVVTLKNEAAGKMAQNVIDFELDQARIRNLPQVMAEMVKPVSAIKDVRIMHTGGGGLLGGGSSGEGGGVGFGEGLAGQLLQVHALRPMIDEVLRQAGFKPGDDPVKTLASVVTGDSGRDGHAVPPAAMTAGDVRRDGRDGPAVPHGRGSRPAE